MGGRGGMNWENPAPQCSPSGLASKYGSVKASFAQNRNDGHGMNTFFRNSSHCPFTNHGNVIVALPFLLPIDFTTCMYLGSNPNAIHGLPPGAGCVLIVENMLVIILSSDEPGNATTLPSSSTHTHNPAPTCPQLCHSVEIPTTSQVPCTTMSSRL